MLMNNIEVVSSLSTNVENMASSVLGGSRGSTVKRSLKVPEENARNVWQPQSGPSPVVTINLCPHAGFDFQRNQKTWRNKPYLKKIYNVFFNKLDQKKKVF